MTKTKVGKRLALLVLSALGLIVAFTMSAQADETGTFWVGIEKGFLLAAFTGSQEGVFKELSFANDLVVNCQAGSFKGAIETPTSGNVEIVFQECTALSDATGKELSCTVDEPFVVKAKITPFLHVKTKDYVTFEPLLAGGSLGTLVLLGECPAHGSYSLTGSISAEVSTNNSAKNLLTFSQGFSQLVKDTLKMNAFQAFWTGKYTWELAGVHKGSPFGVI